MDTIMRLDQAQHRMAELREEAERDRLVQQYRTNRAGAIDAVGFRARIARLIGVIPPLGSGSPRPVRT